MDEKMQVSVLRQGPSDAAYGGNPLPSAVKDDHRDFVRESILIGARSRKIVSHNIALIHADLVPPALLERIAHGQEGIGKAISSIGLESLRKIADYGTIGSDAALDLHGKPVKLQFTEPCESVFYKKYVIYFGLLPGIQLLEYFNPHIVKHRLEQELNGEGGIRHE